MRWRIQAVGDAGPAALVDLDLLGQFRRLSGLIPGCLPIRMTGRGLRMFRKSTMPTGGRPRCP